MECDVSVGFLSPARFPKLRRSSTTLRKPSEVWSTHNPKARKCDTNSAPGEKGGHRFDFRFRHAMSCKNCKGGNGSSVRPRLMEKSFTNHEQESEQNEC